MAQRQLENDQSQSRASAVQAEAASPLGQDQQFAQKMKMLQTMLGGARNFSVQPGDPRVAAAMGSTSGGMRIP
jgi:hypothetical protein